MRSLQLQAALTGFVAQATTRLHTDVLAGQEVPFELAAQSGRGRGASPLYCYQPLTDAYIAERFSSLRSLEAYPPAAAMLHSFDGLDRYLLSRGLLDARDRRSGLGAGMGALTRRYWLCCRRYAPSRPTSMAYSIAILGVSNEPWSAWRIRHLPLPLPRSR